MSECLKSPSFIPCVLFSPMGGGGGAIEEVLLSVGHLQVINWPFNPYPCKKGISNLLFIYYKILFKESKFQTGFPIAFPLTDYHSNIFL